MPLDQGLSDGSENRHFAILHWMQELAPHGIFTTDTQLRLQTWNHWLETHSELSGDAVIGKPLTEVFPDIVTRKFDDPYRRALEGQVSVLSTALHGHLLPFPVTVPDSGYEYMQQTARIGPLLSETGVCGTITTIEDVTQREMQAAAFHSHAANLESKVHERTSRLKETIAELETFSYTVAHDLRAPIRSLKGYAEVLLEDHELPDTAREYLGRMKRAVLGMDLLTRDLLRFSQISRQSITVEAIDVDELVNEIVTHTPSLQRPGILTVHRPLYRVGGNRTMVRQCLANLLDNALKFVAPDQAPRIAIRSEVRQSAAAPSSGASLPTPFISATSEESNNGVPNLLSGAGHYDAERRIRIYVEDNGIGVAPKHHRQIFGVFERICHWQEYEGTGIGLAIVARAMERMHGQCGVESLPDVGSAFWIELPAVV